MALREIAIDWRGQNPASHAKNWFTWKDQNEFVCHPTEKSLNWPHGTIDILHKACELKLSRETGWIAPNLAAFQKAAQVFKRGVLLNSEEPFRGSGDYLIRECQKPELDVLLLRSSCVILDRNVFQSWPELFPADVTKHCILVDVHEKTKDLDAVAKIVSNPIFKNADVCCIIGGGVLGDIASFAAALERKTFSFVPTTLVSMIDSSVGGKTGVNLSPFGKNLVGLFAFPSAVYIYPEFLGTLPDREWRAGQFEALKHAVLTGDRKLFYAVDNLSKQNLITWQMLADLIRVKADIIQQDPYDLGVRSTLNLGHTFGHALEAYALEKNMEMRHGEAVGIGLMFALKLSQDLNLLRDYSVLTCFEESRCWQNLIPVWRSIISSSDASEFANDLVRFLSNDKKNDPIHESRWILPSGWGLLAGSDPHHFVTVKNEQILKTLARLIC